MSTAEDLGGASTEPVSAGATGRSGLGLLVPFAVLLILVGYLPGLAAPSVSFPTLVVWTVAGPGLVALALLVRGRDAAGCVLVAFLAWALVCTVLADRPWQSLSSGIGSAGGLVFLVAYGAWWALGRMLPSEDGRPVGIAIAAGMAVNVAVAIAQVLWTQDSGILSLEYERGVGLFTNPVYFGGALAGTLPLAVVGTVRSTRDRWWWGLAPIALFAAGLQLSGSRVALVASIGLVIGALVLHRVPWRRALAVLAAVVVGLVLASGATPQVGSARLSGADASGGLAQRTLMWEAGRDSIVEHPLFGVGPGRFRSVGAPAIDAAFARAEGPGVVYYDAHNIAVETAVTTGLPGLALLVAFGILAGRRARGPLAWFAAGVALTWLLEPTAAMTAPLALLAVGLAYRRPPAASDEDRPTWGRVAMAAAVVLGLVGAVFGGRVLLADAAFERSRSTYDLADVERAASLAPRDPVVEAARIRLLLTQANADPTPENQASVLDAARRLVDLDPSNPVAWAQLADVTSLYGGDDPDIRAQRAYDLYVESLERNPWSLSSLTAAHQLAVRLGDDAAAERWADRLCQLDACPEGS